ncbi:MAG: radical SAM protein [Terracidiphilus sp.]|jgi:uncharacterized protein
MDSMAATQEAISSDPQLVSIASSLPAIRIRPSQFNARTVAKDGTLLLYNSFSGAFSGLPPHAREKAEALLHKEGTSVEQTGIAKYMLDRGFLVPDTANELNKFRALYGFQHYRSDWMSLVLLASEECNFRCVYCYESYARGTMEPWVRQAIVAMAERRIKELRRLEISWFGGEPLLGLDAIRDISPRLQDLARENHVNFSSSMTTNGFLLTQEVLAELLGYGVSFFQISLDGSPTDHDCKRGLKGGGASFQTIYDNLKAARHLSDQFTILIRVNFDKDNLSRVPGFLDMLKLDFGNDPRFQLMFHPVNQWGGANDDQLNVCGSTEYSSRMDLLKAADTMGLKQLARLPRMQGPTGATVCRAARPFALLIGADGKIMKCTLPLDQKDYNVLGHLNLDGTTDIDPEKFDRWVTPVFDDDEVCKKCFYLPVCQGNRCPNARFGGSRPCPDEKTNIVATLNSLWEQRSPSANQYRVEETGPAVRIENAQAVNELESGRVSNTTQPISLRLTNEELPTTV